MVRLCSPALFIDANIVSAGFDEHVDPDCKTCPVNFYLLSNLTISGNYTNTVLEHNRIWSSFGCGLSPDSPISIRESLIKRILPECPKYAVPRLDPLTPSATLSRFSAYQAQRGKL